MLSPVVLVLRGFFGLPLASLTHELGHAVTALWFTDQPIDIYVGQAAMTNVPGARSYRSPVSAWGISVPSNRASTRAQMLLKTLAGVGTSAGLALGAWPASKHIGGIRATVLLGLAAIIDVRVWNLLLGWVPQLAFASYPFRPSTKISYCVVRGLPAFPFPRNTPVNSIPPNP